MREKAQVPGVTVVQYEQQGTNTSGTGEKYSTLAKKSRRPSK